MTLFIATIFIAELIIAFALISLILKADAKVLALNSQIIEFTPCLEEIFCNFRAALQRNRTVITVFCRALKYRRRFNLIKSIILTGISLFALLKNPLTYVKIRKKRVKK